MATRTPLLVLLLMVGCVLGACQSPMAAPLEQRDFVMVLLYAGPKAAELPADQRRKIQAGHLASIRRLADGEQLLVAGPCGRNPDDPDLRGIFVLNTQSISDAAALVSGDPAVQAEVLRAELLPMTTAADLVELLRVDQAARAAREAAGDTRMEAGMRTFVFAMAEDGPRLERALAGDPGLLMAARLHGGERGWYLFDATDVDAARTWIAGRDVGPLSLYPWFGSQTLADGVEPKDG